MKNRAFFHHFYKKIVSRDKKYKIYDNIGSAGPENAKICKKLPNYGKDHLKNDKIIQNMTKYRLIFQFSLKFYQNIRPGQFRTDFRHQKSLNS